MQDRYFAFVFVFVCFVTICAFVFVFADTSEYLSIWVLVFLCISEESVGQCKLWPRGTYWISPSDAARHFGFMDFWHFRPNNGFLPHLSQNPDHWDKKLIDPHLVFDQWEPSLTWRDLSKIAACGSQRHVWHGKPIKPREITSHDTPSQSNQRPPSIIGW